MYIYELTTHVRSYIYTSQQYTEKGHVDDLNIHFVSNRQDLYQFAGLSCMWTSKINDIEVECVFTALC